MKTGLQPSQQTRLGATQIHTRHADLGESQLLPPSLQLRYVQRRRLRGASLCVWMVHLVIVKTPPLMLRWPDESATQAFAQYLAKQTALRNAFVSLQGNLGAGKTTLVRHLLGALGVQGRVKSPTYTVVEPYSVPGLDIWHFDFYRFSDPREWEDAGFRDIFASPGLKLAEWPDKAAGALPLPDLEIRWEVNPDQSRTVALQAQSAVGIALLQALQTLHAGPTDAEGVAL